MQLQGRMKALSTVLFLMMFACPWPYSYAAQPDSVYWYINAGKDIWQFQEDVFAFRTISRQGFNQPLNPQVVDKVEFREMARDKIHVVYFNERSTAVERAIVKDDIRNHMDFEAEFPVITKYPDEPHYKNLWFITDDLLLVSFTNPEITEEEIADFKSEYHLADHHIPSPIDTELQRSLTYIFRLDNNTMNYVELLDLARNIYKWMGPDVVAMAKPNLINMHKSSTGDTDAYPGYSAFDEPAASQSSSFNAVNIMNERLVLHFQHGEQFIYGDLTIYDMLGRTTFNTRVSYFNKHQHIPIDNYVPGIYVINYKNFDGRLLHRWKFKKN